KPVFSVLFNKPYMLDDKGKKVYLPEGLVDSSTKTVGDKETLKLTISSAEAGQVVDLKTKDTSGRLAAEEIDSVRVVKVGTHPRNVKMSLERRFFIEESGNTIFGQVDLEKRTIIFA